MQKIKKVTSILIITSLVIGAAVFAGKAFTSIGFTATIISQEAQDIITDKAIENIRTEYGALEKEPTAFLVKEKHDRSVTVFGQVFERYTLTIWDYKDYKHIPVKEIVVPKDIYDAYQTTDVIYLYDNDNDTLLYNDVVKPALLKVVQSDLIKQ